MCLLLNAISLCTMRECRFSKHCSNPLADDQLSGVATTALRLALLI
jgi:hypothetical protein